MPCQGVISRHSSRFAVSSWRRGVRADLIFTGVINWVVIVTNIGKEGSPDMIEARRREENLSATQPELALTAATVAGILRQTREATKRSITDVAAHLRIAERHLTALESSQMDGLPGMTYAVGFVRSYAKFLGLNAEAMAEQFKREMGIVDTKPVLNFPIPANDRPLPGGALALSSLALLAVIYGGWYYANSGSPSPQTPTATLTKPSETMPSAGNQAVLAPAPEPAPGDLPSDLATGSIPDGVFSPPSEAASEAPTMRPIPTPDPVTAAPATSSPSEALASPVNPALIESKIVLRSSADSWIQILNTDNEVVFSQILRRGETYPVPNQSGLRLDTGNAGGLEVLVEGRLLPPLGASGSVRRDVPLDVAKLNSLYPSQQ